MESINCRFENIRAKWNLDASMTLFYSPATILLFFQFLFHDFIVTEIHQSKSQSYSHYHRLAFNLRFGDMHHSSLEIDCTFSSKLLLYKKNQEMLASCYYVLTFVFDNPSISRHCCCWLITENLIIFN